MTKSVDNSQMAKKPNPIKETAKLIESLSVKETIRTGSGLLLNAAHVRHIAKVYNNLGKNNNPNGRTRKAVEQMSPAYRERLRRAGDPRFNSAVDSSD